MPEHISIRLNWNIKALDETASQVVHYLADKESDIFTGNWCEKFDQDLAREDDSTTNPITIQGDRFKICYYRRFQDLIPIANFNSDLVIWQAPLPRMVVQPMTSSIARFNYQIGNSKFRSAFGYLANQLQLDYRGDPVSLHFPQNERYLTTIPNLP